MNELIIDPSEVSVPGVIVERISSEYLGPRLPCYNVRVVARRADGSMMEKDFTAGKWAVETEGRAELVRIIRRSLAELLEVPIA